MGRRIANLHDERVWRFPNGSSIVWEGKMYEGQGLQGYASETMATSDSPRGIISIGKEIEIEVAQLEKQLAIKKELQKLLEENPVIEKFMNLSRGIL